MRNRIFRNKGKRFFALAGICVLSLVSLTGCGSQPAAGSNTHDSQAKSSLNSSAASQSSTLNTGSLEQSSGQDTNNITSETQENVTYDKLAGSLQMVGSTSMEKLANALSEAFMEKYQEVTVTTEFVGSSAGVEAVLSGSADIGNSSRNLKEAELEKGAVENIVAIDGIAVCVDSGNTVTGLTKQQLIDIYTGAVTNWKDVGGSDSPIIVVGREAGSGTRGAFEEILGVEERCAYANELDSTGAVMAKVAATPGAVGYVSLDALNDSVKPLTLDGVEATSENIKAGVYFLSRPFVMATNSAIPQQKEVVQAWFAFVLGEEGQKIVANVGLIPLN